jgi:hypothetical protein
LKGLGRESVKSAFLEGLLEVEVVVHEDKVKRRVLVERRKGKYYRIKNKENSSKLRTKDTIQQLK